jgi:hypothetical protein
MITKGLMHVYLSARVAEGRSIPTWQHGKNDRLRFLSFLQVFTLFCENTAVLLF